MTAEVLDSVTRETASEDSRSELRGKDTLSL